MQLGWEFPRLGFGVMTNSKATAGIVLTRKDERGKYKFWPGRIALKHVDGCELQVVSNWILRFEF